MDAATEKAFTLLLSESEAVSVVRMCRHVLQVDAVAGENERIARDLADVIESQLEQ